MNDHPRGNYWFASRWQEGDEPHPDGFPWRPYIQLPGMVDHLDTWFPTKEACEEYIRSDILGAELGDLPGGDKAVPCSCAPRGHEAWLRL